MPMLADILDSELREELVPTVLVVGFNDRFKGASPTVVSDP